MSATAPGSGDAPEPEGTDDAPATDEVAGADPAGRENPSVEVPDDLSGLDDAGAAPAEGAGSDVPTVEDLLSLVESLTTERDDYLGRWQRNQADFENSRRRLQRDAEAAAGRAASRLAEELLPVLDACDAALAHGEKAVEPIFAALLQSLEKNGLRRIDPTGEEFDPNQHEAVVHEPSDEPLDTPVVSEVLRVGYAWDERVLRAAMVKVKG